MIGTRFGRGWVFGATVAAAAAVSLLGGAAAAATSSQEITSAGPLTNIWIGTDLSCQVAHTDDQAYELYGQTEAPGDCGTFVATGGALYAPDFGNHAYTFTRNLGTYVPFAAVGQSAVTGSGTSGDPYRVVTVADVGATGLRITETDSYVVGQETYRTDVQIANGGGQAQSLILYRAGDCYLQGSDQGFGAVGSPAGAVACTASTGSRIEQWVPLSPGSHYLETSPGSLWTAIAGRTGFPDTCDCTTNEDNGAGLSWTLSIPAGGSQTVSSLTNFSPAGHLPLTTSKTADQAAVGAGGQDGYTIALANSNATGVQVASISDTLPAGFTYLSGSTTGATTSNPTISGRTLTWTGPFTDPASSSISLHFDVTAPSAPGTYFNDATADAGSFSVVPTGDTAPVTVSAATTHTLAVSRTGAGSGSVSSSPAGITCGATCSASFTAGATVTLTATPAAGSTFGGWSGGGCSGTGTCTVTLTADTSVTAAFGTQGTSARAHQLGWWKNHDGETSALLPVSLGNYAVSNLAAASAVFGANNCGRAQGDGVGCLAAELLAAKLNQKNGSGACIQSTVSAADALLAGVGYSGPADYTVTDAQRGGAISLKNALQSFDGSGSC